MKQIIEQITVAARKSKYIDQQSGVSRPLQHRQLPHDGRLAPASAAVRLGEKPAVPRISDLGHLYCVVARQAGARPDGQPPDVRAAGARRASSPRRSATSSTNTSKSTAWPRSPKSFGKGVKIEVGDMLPSAHYADRLKRVPPVWDKAFEVNAAGDPAVRASCVEFVLAGLYAIDKISRAQQHGRIVYEL